MGKREEALVTWRTVRYRVGVGYSECPLKEVLLYYTYSALSSLWQ